MKYKIDKHSFMLIAIFSAMQVLFALYYAYFCLGSDFIAQKEFLKVLMGGIRIEDSANMLCVMINIFPKCLFCVYVANFFMKELKTNFFYIFLRTRKRERWLRGVAVKTCISALCYEVFFGIMVAGIKIFMQGVICFSIKEFLVMFVMGFLQLLMFALFSNILLLFVSETAAILGTFLEIGAPVLLISFVYENNGAWQYFAKWIPLNLGNYNYIRFTDMDLLEVIIVIVLLCILIYLIAMKRLNKYELI